MDRPSISSGRLQPSRRGTGPARRSRSLAPSSPRRARPSRWPPRPGRRHPASKAAPFALRRSGCRVQGRPEPPEPAGPGSPGARWHQCPTGSGPGRCAGSSGGGYRALKAPMPWAAPHRKVRGMTDAAASRSILRDPVFARLWFIQAANQVGGNMALYALTVLVFDTTRSNSAVSALLVVVRAAADRAVAVRRGDRRPAGPALGPRRAELGPDRLTAGLALSGANIADGPGAQPRDQPDERGAHPGRGLDDPARRAEGPARDRDEHLQPDAAGLVRDRLRVPRTAARDDRRAVVRARGRDRALRGGQHRLHRPAECPAHPAEDSRARRVHASRSTSCATASRVVRRRPRSAGPSCSRRRVGRQRPRRARARRSPRPSVSTRSSSRSSSSRSGSASSSACSACAGSAGRVASAGRGGRAARARDCDGGTRAGRLARRRARGVRRRVRCCRSSSPWRSSRARPMRSRRSRHRPISSRSTPADVRGRVFGVLASIVSAASLVPSLVAGPLADRVSASLAIGIVGIAVVLVGVWSAWYFGPTKGESRQGGTVAGAD